MHSPQDLELKSQEELLDELEAQAPYLKITIDCYFEAMDGMLSEHFENQEIHHVIPKFQEDLDFFIATYSEIPRDTEEEKAALAEVNQTLLHILIGLDEDHLEFQVLENILRRLGIVTPPIECNTLPYPKGVNVHLPRRQAADLLRKCNLTEFPKEGSGSHTKWKDQDGTPRALLARSNKIWLKPVIKSLIAHGVDTKTIEQSCADMNYHVKIVHPN